MVVEERFQNRVAKNESTTDLESSDTGQKTKRKSWQKKLSPAAIQCRKFAGSDFKFLMLDYLVDSLYFDSVIDPTLTSYIREVTFQLFKSMTSDF